MIIIFIAFNTTEYFSHPRMSKKKLSQFLARNIFFHLSEKTMPEKNPMQGKNPMKNTLKEKRKKIFLAKDN